MYRGNRKGFTLVELMIVLVILVIVSSIAFGNTGHGFANMSHGLNQKVGQVVKFGKQGILNDTWEGQIIRGGLNNGSGAFGGVLNFTVEDDSLVEKVQEYMLSQKEVVILYRIEGLYSPFRSESGGRFLIGIRPLKVP